MVEKVLDTLRQYDSFSYMKETASCLLDVHVPEDKECDDSVEQRSIRESSRIAPETIDAPLFTKQELIRAVRTFKNNKAPGFDLIKINVLKMACRVISDQIVRIYNGYLQWGIFPLIWKKGFIAIPSKGQRQEREGSEVIPTHMSPLRSKETFRKAY